MKKLFTICLLVGALLMGSMPFEAKTTKKTTRSGQTSKSTSSSFTINSFMKNSGRGFELKSLKQIQSILTSNGYKYLGSEYTQISELDADSYIYKDSKGNIVTVTAINDSNAGAVNDVNEITFTFINSKERDKFTKGKTNEIYGAHDQVQMAVDGNTVTLVDDCYYC